MALATSHATNQSGLAHSSSRLRGAPHRKCSSILTISSSSSRTLKHRRQPPVLSAASTDSSSSTETRTATVQVDLGYAAEQAVVRLTQPKSHLVKATMAFPLGLVLENVDGEVVVAEVSEGSAAADADCRVGDVVRVTTAFTMQMTYPTMQLMFGGGGTPKLMKVLIPADKVSFAKVMAAVRSNTREQGGDGKVTLVLERVRDSSSDGDDEGSSSDADSGNDSSSSGGGLRVVSPGQEGGVVFDPRIFNSTFE